LGWVGPSNHVLDGGLDTLVSDTSSPVTPLSVTRRSTTAYTQSSPARRATLAGRSSAGAVQAVCNGPSMSAARSTTVHDELLHPHLRHCSSPASAVRRLQSAVRTATPAFHVRSSGLFCSRPGGLELVTRLPVRSVTRFFDSFRRDLKTFLFWFLLAYTAHWRLCDHVLYKSTIGIDIDANVIFTDVWVTVWHAV